MGENDEQVQSYLTSWNGRLRGALVELAILYLASFSPEKPHAYFVYKQLHNHWGEYTPPLPTIYSAINRLEEQGFVKIKNEIENNRVRKTIYPSESSWDLMKQMQNDLVQVLSTFESDFKSMLR